MALRVDAATRDDARHSLIAITIGPTQARIPPDGNRVFGGFITAERCR